MKNTSDILNDMEKIKDVDCILFLMNEQAFKEDFGEQWYNVVKTFLENPVNKAKYIDKIETVTIDDSKAIINDLVNTIKSSIEDFFRSITSEKQLIPSMSASSDKDDYIPITNYYRFENKKYEIKTKFFKKNQNIVMVEFIKDSITTNDFDNKSCKISCEFTGKYSTIAIDNGVLTFNFLDLGIDLNEIQSEELKKRLNQLKITIEIDDYQIEIN